MTKDQLIRVDPKFKKMVDELADKLSLELGISRKKIGSRLITGKIYDKLSTKRIKL